MTTTTPNDGRLVQLVETAGETVSTFLNHEYLHRHHPYRRAHHFEIEAETPAEAESKAWELPTEEGDVSWEMLENFGRGHICSCPSPWEVTVEEV